MKTKHLLIAVLTMLGIATLTLMNINKTAAADTKTPTLLGIKTGVFMFFKDTGTSMNSYFGGNGPNTSMSIDIGTYNADINPIAAASSGDHRFTVSDMAGKSFQVTLQSSDLTADDGTGGTLTVAKANIGYQGTTRVGTGKALTAAATGAADIGTDPVVFVARSNNSGVSKYSQEISITVAIPAAQGPGSYTGMLTFTY